MVTTPTEEQRAVLENPDGVRVRIVSAAPGSGKTWLVGELIRRELSGWNAAGGIAALSFTNVAREAISQALGGRLPPQPHFVGTLDSFIYRFIFRKFGPSVASCLGRLRLVPGDVSRHFCLKWKDENLGLKIGNQWVGLLDIHPIRMDQGKVVLGYTDGLRGAVRTVPAETWDYAWKRKRWQWNTLALASHSDVGFLSAWLLNHKNHGAAIRKLMAQRFPLLVVDELQDTGWFMGAAIRALLQSETTRGILVGDRDQAIFEFGGATPEDLDRFDQLKGAVRFPLRTTQRCPKKVCSVAERLGSQIASVNPREGADDGHTLLLVYDDEPDVAGLCAGLERELGLGEATILVRSDAARQQISGANPAPPEFKSRPLSHFWRACAHLQRGSVRKGHDAASAGAASVVFGVEAAPAERLVPLGLSERDWRQLVVDLLMRAGSVPTDTDVYDWALRIRDLLQGSLGPLAIRAGEKGSIRRPAKAVKGAPASTLVPEPRSPSARRCVTVHGAKGETHNMTFLYWPKPKKKNRCPSVTWFSGDAEEKRVGYVAVTRPRHALALCVHRSTYLRMAAAAPSFVDLFEMREV